MTNKRSLRGLLHWATHRIPGVPAHGERPAGHQGTAVDVTPHHSPNHGRNHSAARPPRVMVAWQRRIAAFFGREV